jgi:hypothetical protein
MDMIMKAILCILTGVLLACAPLPGRAEAGAVVQPPKAPPETEFDKRIAALAVAGSAITVEEIGRSREGRPIHMMRLGAAKPGPAILIVAGANGQHWIGTETAVRVAEKLAADHKDLLNTATVYVLPSLNPDAAERVLTETPRRDSGRTISPVDDDRDARIDEDPAADLNGDGMITLMRVANPPPGYGIELTEMIDPSDARLMKKPDRAKGEKATHAVLVEGRDEDGDGRIAEDGPDGTDLTMNFPARWPEFREGAGPFEISEPEMQALARWIMAHDEVVCVLIYGPHDNLVKVPEAGKMDATGQVPEGIENDDKAIYEQISTVFKDITKMTEAPAGDAAGALHSWAYAHLGLFSFTTPVWVRPDQLKKEEEKKEGEEKKEDGAKPAGEPGAGQPPGGGGPSDAEIDAMIAEFQNASPAQRRELMGRVRAMPPEVQARIRSRFGPGGRAGPGAGDGRPAPGQKGSDADDAKWLKYSDELRNKEGFVDWQPFEHPQLGPVEIGGFVPGFKSSPARDDAETIARLADEQTRFAADLLGKLPRVVNEEPVAERLGTGVWRISVKVVNEGYLPTKGAIGVKARRLPPMLVTIGVPDAAVLSGDRYVRIPSLAGSGGSRNATWVVAAEDGSTVEVVVRSVELGELKIPVVLKEQDSGPATPGNGGKEGVR